VSELGAEAAIMASELVQEEMKEGEGGHRSPRWHTWVAMSTMAMALVTALGALLAGITAHETLMERTQEAIDISIAENDQVSIEVLLAKVEILESLGYPINPADLARIDSYEEEFRERKAAAVEDEAAVSALNFPHLILAISVTLLSIGITMSGMAVIVDKRYLWLSGVVFGVLGSIGVGIGIANMVS
jgi:hypothetical protein